jgi:radical SAM protein with 4Fe4S-binding SPASM domain
VKSRDCTEPWRSLYIDPRGRLFPCAASEIHFKRKIESGRYDSGNILDRPIGEIWNNPFWQALRRSNLRAGSEAIVPECACCGMTIGWSGPCAKDAHLMDWRASEDSSLRL